MYSHQQLMMDLVVVLLLCGVLLLPSTAKDVPFDDNYRITYGNDHVAFFNQGTQLQLSMDVHSGAGFGSKVNYGSGFFDMRIKVPNKDSAGVVTTFYLSSNSQYAHDEVDFEFLGNKEGKPYALQTNVFARGVGGREERTLLWFDPTADFHSYQILWNPYHIVFYVDNIPIRIYKNNTASGVGYPSQPMQILASLWDGDGWATDGGKTKTDWSQAPFIASYQDFNVDGCPLTDNQNMDIQRCQSPNYWWNQRKFWKLDSNQMKAMEAVRNKYMNYDYCSDRNRYPVPPLECSSNTYE
ncbi:xyloglucan endotransglucosylase/hydrolase protein 2-like [Coffea arabica]|uniref:Xyloglucan endotransglucosylase/hydrolase n=1 Tax=Coffea arabica TaxID=13443 RepID=A0ABM4X0B3_COFAR